MNLSFLEEMRDKAARIIPTPFAELVEQATSELLLGPDWERILLLCDHANSNADHIVDLVRAVRRRIDNKSPKVQYFTVVLLEALVKNCGVAVHMEIADTKALLRDLVGIAIRTPARDGEREAKTAALTLILNFGRWFVSHPEPKCRLLATLEGIVRGTGETFAGIEMDTTTVINTRMPAAQQKPDAQRPGALQRARNQRQRQAETQGRAAASTEDGAYPAAATTAAHQQARGTRQGAAPLVVQAIPIVIPSEEQISGMMDAVMLLVDYLNNSESAHASILQDEVLSSIATTVRRDYHSMSILLDSGAELGAVRDLLQSVCESQGSVIQRLGLAATMERQHSEEALQSDSGATVQGHIVEGVGHPTATTTGTVAAPAAPPAPSPAAGSAATAQAGSVAEAPHGQPQQQQQPAGVAPPPPRSAVPTIDELFAAAPIAPAAAPGTQQVSKKDVLAARKAPAAGGPGAARPVTATIDDLFGGSEMTSIVPAVAPTGAAPTAPPQGVAPFPPPVQQINPQTDALQPSHAAPPVEPAAPHPASVAATPAVAHHSSAGEAEGQEMVDVVHPPHVSTSASLNAGGAGDDEFDAFLNNRLAK